MDTDRNAADQLARTVGADFSTTDREAAMSRPEVNAIIVSSSEHEHTAPVIAALKKRGPVLVEKPIALTVDDADLMLRTVAELEGDLRVGYSRRFKTRYQLAKEQILQGRLGTITGACARLYVSYALPSKYPSVGHAARVELLGTDGVLLINDDHTDQILQTEAGFPHVYLPGEHYETVFLESSTPGDWALGDFLGPIADETRSWLDYLSTGKPCHLATPADARRTWAVTLAIEESARSGRIVQVAQLA